MLWFFNILCAMYFDSSIFYVLCTLILQYYMCYVLWWFFNIIWAMNWLFNVPCAMYFDSSILNELCALILQYFICYILSIFNFLSLDSSVLHVLYTNTFNLQYFFSFHSLVLHVLCTFNYRYSILDCSVFYVLHTLIKCCFYMVCFMSFHYEHHMLHTKKWLNWIFGLVCILP